MQDLIGYDEIIENAMRNVIHQILQNVEKNGLQGGHYFVISFSTKHPSVIIPEYLKVKFPEEMTIVIQHQFQGFKTETSLFKISLSFSGTFESLVVPYQAITSFADPSMNFGLRFSSLNEEEIEEKGDDTIFLKPDSATSDQNKSEKTAKGKKTSKVNKAEDLSAKVISLDAFRKNKNNNKKD